MKQKPKTKRIQVNNCLLSQMVRKARRSGCTYKVCAIGLDAQNNVLGCVNNVHAKWDVLQVDGVGRAGTSWHAEARLIARYGKNLKTILIARTGNGGNLLPIDPCDNCRHLAEKLGIRIYSISEK